MVICLPENIAAEKHQAILRFGARLFPCVGVPFSDVRNYARHAEVLSQKEG